MDQTTARDRRVQQMVRKGYTSLSPSERAAKLAGGLNALKRLASNSNPNFKGITDEERGR